MTYSKYTNMSTEELVALVFNDKDVHELTLELATRLIAAEDELSDFTEGKSLEDVLEMADRRQSGDRRRVRLEQD